MEKSKVIVIKQFSYDEEEIYRKVKAACDRLGGMESFVGKDEKVLVKPNFLYPSAPDKAVTTHPAVIRAALRLLSESGVKSVKYGDSPANGTSKSAIKALGLTEDEFGYQAADCSEEVATYIDGVKKPFYLTREASESDAIVNLPKMKTHMLERITGAQKNLYGLILGFRKATGHVSYPNAVSFAKMIANLETLKKPRINIMDGITAMEGNGPASGTPVNMGVILVSKDPVALDTVFCYLIDLEPKLVPTNVYGELKGLGTMTGQNIEIEIFDEERGLEFASISGGELLKSYGNPNFDCQREKEKLNVLTLWAKLTSGFTRRPAIDENKCVKCGVCVDHCPVEGKAVTFKNGKASVPVYDYKKCIRCYCCQEICPQHAIYVK